MPRQLLRRQLSYGSHRGGWIKQSRHLQQTVPLVGIHVRALSALEVCLTVRKHFFTGWMQKSSENTTPLPSPSRADTALIIINFLKASIQWSQQTSSRPLVHQNMTEILRPKAHFCTFVWQEPWGLRQTQLWDKSAQKVSESCSLWWCQLQWAQPGPKEKRGGIMYYHFTGI